MNMQRIKTNRIDINMSLLDDILLTGKSCSYKCPDTYHGHAYASLFTFSRGQSGQRGFLLQKSFPVFTSKA